MAKKKQDNETLLKNLTKETQTIIKEKFLCYYTGKGKLDYKSAIVRMLNNEIKKKDAREINYQDYLELRSRMYPEESVKKPTQFTYRESFIRFLFAFDYLYNSSGFEKIFIKEDIIKEFASKSKKNSENKEEYKPHLTLQKIYSIESILKVIDNNDINKIKEAFSWYMLFYTDCSINLLRNEINAKSYINGKIILKNGKEYDVPNKFINLFKYLEDRTYTGFDLDLAIYNLGNKVGLNNLKAGDIRQSRKENLITCQTCGNQYLNLCQNWKVVNDRVICRYCAEEFKKKDNFKVTDLVSEDVFENVTEDIEKASVYYTYDQLKNKLNKQINYLELHKYLIEIGKLGEAFVYDYERNRLIDSKYENKVDSTPSLDPSKGYDIKSFERNGEEIYIEVKTTTGFDNMFYISDNELKTAKKMIEENKKYYIYRVYNILAKNKEEVKIKIFKDITDEDKYIIKPNNYKVEVR